MPNHAAVLVTGMSGVGKSTALTELKRRGFTAVDTDDGPWIDVVDGEPLWRTPLIDELLSRPRATPLFVQGTVANQGRFYNWQSPVTVETLFCGIWIVSAVRLGGQGLCSCPPATAW